MPSADDEGEIVTQLAMLPHLRGLLEVTRHVRSDAELQELFEAVARSVSELLGYRTAVVNVYRRAWDDFEVVAVHGSGAAADALLGQRTGWEGWRNYLQPRFERSGAYFVPAEEIDWDDPSAHIPDFAPLDDADAWRPDDALLVPLEGSDGEALGILSVDEPHSGLRPTDDELETLAALAAHLASAIESAQGLAAAARDRAALARLLEVSSHLDELAGDPDELLAAVADAIRSALGFGLVVVAIADEHGVFRPRAAVGWPHEAPLDFALSVQQVEPLFVPEFECGGCYLLGSDEAVARAGEGLHVSTQNGRGPHAWNRHWLLVPLHDRGGALRGYVWADEPEDRLIPSRERLEVLRTFANQANAALSVAFDRRALERRNDELTALHGTTRALLHRLDLDGVLHAIVDQARSLVGTEHAYAYLVDPDRDELRLAVRLGMLESADDVSLRRGEGVGGTVWETGSTVYVDDYGAWAGGVGAFARFDLHAVLGVPLRAGDEVLGVVGLAFAEEGRRFGAAEVGLVERFADMASLALVNARLYDALHRTEKLHRSVVESSTDMITLLDLDGNVVFASPSHEHTLGYGIEELTSRPYAALVHPEDLPGAADVLARAAAGETPAAFPARVRHRDGHWVHLEGIPSVIRDDAGCPELILAVTRDVTDRERLQEQLRQAQKMESVGRLAGGIAHDFNNLLTAIVGYADLARLELAEGSEAAEFVGEIARAAGRAAELTSQLLAFSRKQVLRPRPLDLNDSVQQMASMLSRMLGDDVVVSTALDPDLGLALADPGQVEQIVLNLAVNARDAMPSGGQLLIETAHLDVGGDAPPPHPDLAPGRYVSLTVRDSGVGMAPSVAARVFEPFYTTKPVGDGTGLGLATVHGIASQSGGAVWLETAPGAGSSFTVCLPRLEEPQPR